jgi:hypothetical protein
MSESPLKGRTPIQIITAYHKAAHAVVQYRVAGFSDAFVTILPTLTMVDDQVDKVGRTEDASSDGYCAEHLETRILTCYAGGHAGRRCEPNHPDLCSEGDEGIAENLLREWGWEHREQEFRDRSRDLVEKHWAEIDAVAMELLKTSSLDSGEIELIADATAGIAQFFHGDLDRDLAAYRAFRGNWSGTVADDNDGA